MARPKSKRTNRAQRINDLIQTTLATILQKNIKDIPFGMVTITGVDANADLTLAKVFVSVLDENKATETLEILNNAAKYLRYELANEVDLRVTPELRFVYDDSVLRGHRISSLINHALKD